MMKFVQGKKFLAYFSFAYFVSLKRRCFSLQSTLSMVTLPTNIKLGSSVSVPVTFVRKQFAQIHICSE
jgi:hypothetical protein